MNQSDPTQPSSIKQRKKQTPEEIMNRWTDSIIMRSSMNQNPRQFHQSLLTTGPQPPLIREVNTPLLPNFTPSAYSVLIGRGKLCSEAVGSRRLKVIASRYLDEYSNASSRIEKSSVVTKIVDIIQEACPVGAFVKQEGGQWWEVSDNLAREKVGAVLRDALHEHYKSSTKAKLAKRKRKQALLIQEPIAGSTSSVPQNPAAKTEQDDGHFSMAPSLDFQTSISSVVLPFREANSGVDKSTEFLERIDFGDLATRGSTPNDGEDKDTNSNSRKPSSSNNKAAGVHTRYSLEEAVSDFSHLSPPTTRRKVERAKSAPSLSESIHSIDEAAFHNSFPSFHSKTQMPGSSTSDESSSRELEDDIFAFENDKEPN
jgi:hypothetical protein